MRELIEKLQRHGIRDQRVLYAIAATPRELFVPPDLQEYAYEDRALPIDCEQTISQPYVVARMTELILHATQNDKVLEIGTGSGYQAAVLSQLFKKVYTIERFALLLQQAEKRFKQLNLNNIVTLCEDGQQGWPEHSPFNSILVTAAANQVPSALLNQLADQGRLIIPVGDRYQQYLQLIIRNGKQYEVISYDPVLFVPLLSGTVGHGSNHARTIGSSD